MTISRWRGPAETLALIPLCRMGLPPRSLAADAHVCIMVRVFMTHRIQGCGAKLLRPVAGSPRDRHSDHAEHPIVLAAVKTWPGNDRVSGNVSATAILTAAVRDSSWNGSVRGTRI